MELESYFEPFRSRIVGMDTVIRTPFGEKPLVYADWIASGRLYWPIEDLLSRQFGPLVGNTHSESSETGSTMTRAYQEAHKILKAHVHAGADDVIITTGFGMTSALAKFQRILGIKIPERLSTFCNLPEEERPVVFITHMEHHSNHTPWLESLADVVILPPGPNLEIQVQVLEEEIAKYRNRRMKIGSFTACSNVTGIETPYHRLAAVMHAHGGYCFVDFAASAPYIRIDMHPPDPAEALDAVFFSPHKFLGGPGSSGVLIFNKNLYHNRIPDHPGGGTVLWTNPWGEHAYVDDIEIREDGGTPGFLQAIKAALSVRLKEQMEIGRIRDRERELVRKAFRELRTIPGLHILAESAEDRLAVFSFYLENVHHNLTVKLLNDRYGIQVRGGCSCAGTYGHYLLNVDRERSHRITERISLGDLTEKPGWVRLSLHPTTTDAELDYMADALRETARHAGAWSADYRYDPHTAEFEPMENQYRAPVETWFELP
jgi:selenocysteine lyase/cysteine desulfurase